MNMEMLFLIAEFAGLFLFGFLFGITVVNGSADFCLGAFKAQWFFGIVGVRAGGALYITDSFSDSLILYGGIGAIAAGIAALIAVRVLSE